MHAAHFHKVPSQSAMHGGAVSPTHDRALALPTGISTHSPVSRHGSTSMAAHALSLSRTTAQASCPTTPLSAHDVTDATTKVTVPAQSDVAEHEGGTFAPLLEQDGYQAERVTRRSSPRTERRRTRAELPRRSSRAECAGTTLMRVRGVDALRFRVTGLLARHVGPLPTALAASSHSATLPRRTGPRLSAQYATVPSHTLDDRITPHTLHTLLKKDRLAAGFLLPRTTTTSVPDLDDADDDDDERHHRRAVLRGDIGYLEPPSLTLAHTALYHPTHHSDGTTLTSRPPVEPSVRYPPVPRQYASAAEEKWARTLQRLAPVRPRRAPAVTRANAEDNSGVVAEEPESTGPGALDPLSFTSASRGEDGRLVERLVATYAARPATTRVVRPALTAAALAATPHASPPSMTTPTPFSALQAVLCVSREYASMASQRSGCDSAATVSEERRGVVRRLTDFDSTRVPEQFWVTTPQGATPETDLIVTRDVTSAHTEASSAIAAVSRQPNCARAVHHPDTTVFFPAACPTSRSQVYLLADAVDTMMAGRPDALRVLADPNTAFCIVPPAATDVVADESDDPLLDAAVRETSAAAYETYTNAARWVVDVLDTGLVELVRQVGAHCIERGALLDALRQTLVDVAQGHMRVLAHAKRRAFEEATRRWDATQAMLAARAETERAREQVRTLEAEKAQLERREKELALKAARLDELLARVAAKRQRLELHSFDEHACLLQELEDDMTRAAHDALGTIYDEQVRLAGDAAAGERRGSVAEAPSAAEARKRAAQEKAAMAQLYEQSYRLLHTLNDAVAATDAACAPLYDAMVLRKVSPAANVAAARWATIARAVGAFEREKSHRQRVFQVFGDWCERYKKLRQSRLQQQRHAERDAAGDGDFLLESSLDESNSLGELLNASAEDFMELAEGDDAAGRPRRPRRPRASLDVKRIQYITAADLLAMGVTDCTADEVNAMFARTFDFKAYLHLHWQPQSVEHTLTMTDLGQMVHDTEAVLREVVLRMRAIAESAIMQKGCQPPLQPPAHPEEACALCGRRDHAVEDKRKRQTTMQLIAQEVQRQMETLADKCQRAESERQTVRAQAQQLRGDLDRAQEETAQLQRQVNELMAYSAALEQSTTQTGRVRRPVRSPMAGGTGSPRLHVAAAAESGGAARSRRLGAKTGRRREGPSEGRRGSEPPSRSFTSSTLVELGRPLETASPSRREVRESVNDAASTDTSVVSVSEMTSSVMREGLVSQIDHVTRDGD